MYLTTNAKLFVSGVNFTENYSYGRGSVVFVDFQASYASFDNCTFKNNYAYNGGVFYAAYSSIVEITNSLINENFGVVGGVGYVNNDGGMKIWDNTVIT